MGELAGYAEFNHHVKLFLFDVARHHKLPDFDLVLSTSDACHTPGAFNGSTKACPSMVWILRLLKTTCKSSKQGVCASEKDSASTII